MTPTKPVTTTNMNQPKSHNATTLTVVVSPCVCCSVLLTKVIRDRSGDDECNDPPNWHDDGIQDLSILRDQRRSVEYLHQDVVVEHFDTNVAIQTGCDQRCDQGDGIACGLPAVDRNTLIARSVTTDW